METQTTSGEPVSGDLKEYRRKRNFDKTPEPTGAADTPVDRLHFVVQKHAATRLHYDLRLEFGGDFKSWAVPKGPSVNPADQRLAVRVENHPIEYGSFEGIIPPKNYGAGTVMIWDAGWLYARGTSDYKAGEEEIANGYEEGHITFLLEGQKLRGEFALVRLKKGDAKTWLLVKKADKFSSYKVDITLQDKSVATGRSMAEIKEQAKAKGEVWIPGVGASSATLQSPYVSAPRIEVEAKDEALMPHRIKPMLPVMSNKLFLDENWCYDTVSDGTRAILEVDTKKIELYNRTGTSIATRHADLIKDLRSLKQRMVLDGLVVEKKKDVFLAWDLLYLDGVDFRTKPLEERLGALKKVAPHKRLELSESKKGEPVRAVVEGSRVLARHLKSDYRAGIQNAWQSCPNTMADEKSKAPEVKAPVTRERTPVHSSVVLTNVKKVFWPDSGHTKGDVIKYYESVADVILPYLKDRPMSMNRHPNGVTRSSFFQKDVSGYVPSFVETVLVQHSDKTVNYLMCQNKETLLYLANLGCIELNPWLSQAKSLDKPDWAVIDLDPVEVEFKVVVEVAQVVHEVLSDLKIASFCKTSGSKGIHIIVPVNALYDYETERGMIESLCKIVLKKIPNWTSMERSPAKRRKKVYLDFLQNARGQTLASPYSLRPKAKPLVSAPLEWSEVNDSLQLEAFSIETMSKRIAEKGDLWKEIFKTTVQLDKKMPKTL